MHLLTADVLLEDGLIGQSPIEGSKWNVTIGWTGPPFWDQALVDYRLIISGAVQLDRKIIGVRQYSLEVPEASTINVFVRPILYGEDSTDFDKLSSGKAYTTDARSKLYTITIFVRRFRCHTGT